VQPGIALGIPTTLRGLAAGRPDLSGRSSPAGTAQRGFVRPADLRANHLVISFRVLRAPPVAQASHRLRPSPALAGGAAPGPGGGPLQAEVRRPAARLGSTPRAGRGPGGRHGPAGAPRPRGPLRHEKPRRRPI